MITYPNCAFEPMDGWFQFEEFDQSGNEMEGVDFGNANFMTIDVSMKESMELDFKQMLSEENFVQEQNQPSSSSLSSKRTLSIESSDNSSARIFRSNSNSSNSFSGSKTSILQPGNRSLSCSIPNLVSDDDAIARAMMAVISSVSSASSSSSPSIISQNSPKCGENAKFGAFRQFKSAFPPKYEVNFGNDGHKMIKSSLAMLRNIKPGQEREPKASNLYHMISERKRREKLNGSFELLRMLLPPGSKKDKTSVLIKAASYLKTLESQISELKEKTHKLESYLPNTKGGKDARIKSNERAQIQILRTSCAEPHVHQINLRINVVQECDVVELVLRILECLKLMKNVSLASVDAYTFSPQMKLHAQAIIKLHIKDSDWNEALFQQAIEKAVDDVTFNTCTRSMCSELSRIN
ncbi:putative transcription factor bHLH041 isoform X3 [Carex littledalei]|uniref:Putative transcription factor bHLH041 isoform X3 n=1 Tax=Carex littledalei TaxID=544730 RepID=A0A833QS99_9POAL|nr:putative transcription factor bHLH041 isoform X3 [Carex littledalei]